MRSLLLTRPNHDRTTRYVSSWAREVVEIAKEKGAQVYDLKDKRAKRQIVESMITKNRPRLIFFCGHGGESMVCGQDDEILIQVGSNESVLSSSITYCLSCKSAKELGVAAVNTGADAFIGYSEDFIFLWHEDARTRPDTDTLAALFLKPSNQVCISLLKGHSVKESYENSRRSFMRNIAKLLTSESSPTETAAIPWLYSDAVNLTFRGDPEAKL